MDPKPSRPGTPRRLAFVGLLAAMIASPAAPLPAEEAADAEPDPTAELVKSFGIDRWHEVEALRFTFNYSLGEERIGRTWHWEPKAGRVTLTNTLDGEAETPTTWDRDELADEAPEAIRTLDAHFNNDTFWLLLPLHLRWSDDVNVALGPYEITPMGRMLARRIDVTYPAEQADEDDATGGGAADDGEGGEGGAGAGGDRYRLYVDDGWRIVQWAYHKGDAEAPTIVCYWMQDSQVGPLRLCTDFLNDKTGFHVWFTSVYVKTVGEDAWVRAKPIKHKCRLCP